MFLPQRLLLTTDLVEDVVCFMGADEWPGMVIVPDDVGVLRAIAHAVQLS